MSWASSLLYIVRRYEDLILLGLAVLVLILLLNAVGLRIKVGRLNRRKLKVESSDEYNLLEAINEKLDIAQETSNRLEILYKDHQTLTEKQRFCIQRVGMVRFNAFDDVGGEQSFALALLDTQDSGILLCNLFGRSESRAFAKSISMGKSEQALSQEEQQALSRAMKS